MKNPTYMCNIWSLGCVNRKAHIAPSVRHFRTECFENEMLNKKDHSDSPIRTGQSQEFISSKLWKDHLVQYGSPTLRILEIIHVAEIRRQISFDYLKLWVRKIHIRQYLLNQVCWTHHLELIMESRVAPNVSNVYVRNHGLPGSKRNLKSRQICQAEK